MKEIWIIYKESTPTLEKDFCIESENTWLKEKTELEELKEMLGKILAWKKVEMTSKRGKIANWPVIIPTRWRI